MSAHQHASADGKDINRAIPEDAHHTRERFEEKYESGAPDECWEWERYTNADGYGEFRYNGRARAHRISYRLYNGAIPEDKQVNHTCDNRACVNPNHLYLGTQAENIGDAFRRERVDRPLSHDDVREIRRRYATEDVYQYELADEFGVDQATISNVVNRKTHDYVD
ncbi:HNH endonuclease signature motif containing protein [Natrinema sp. 74]|uniref:HNH endonuclease signature motif containing protein n=1 Tax=Natrinema sp. 74 TaxID=3384159 RepID=UPI0038D35CBF